MTRGEKVHRAAGQLAGFPPCCIDFFVNIWIPEMIADVRDVRIHEYGQAAIKEKWEYVPCVECFAKGIDNRTYPETASLDTDATFELAEQMVDGGHDVRI